MARNTGPGHDKSDRDLDKRAFEEEPKSRQRFDADEVRKHDNLGRDRLFEGRQQHDEADKNQEKKRLARDIQRHHHDADNLPGASDVPPIGENLD